MNTVPSYYHWNTGLHTNLSRLVSDKDLIKYRVRLPQHPTVNYTGMLIGPKGATLRELEAKTNCSIFVRTMHDSHVLVIGKRVREIKYAV